MWQSEYIVATVLGVLCCLASALRAEPIRVDQVLVTLIDQVDVPARQRGQIISMAVEGGQVVKAGDLLAQIDDGDAQLVRQRAEINLENAQKEADNTVKVRLAQKSIELARSELERGLASRRLFQNSVTEEELRRRRLVLETAELDHEQAQHEFELAQHQLRFARTELGIAERTLDLFRVVAPLDGIVVKVHHREGEWVEPGAPVARVIQIDRLRAECFVRADQIAGRMQSRPVTLRVTLPGPTTASFSGNLQFVDREVNPVDGMVRLWAEIENPDHVLLPGMLGSMTIHARTK